MGPTYTGPKRSAQLPSTANQDEDFVLPNAAGLSIEAR